MFHLMNRRQTKEVLITGAALGSSTFLLTFGVTLDPSIAFPLSVVVGMGSSLVVSPLRKDVDRFRLIATDDSQKRLPAPKQESEGISKETMLSTTARRSMPLQRAPQTAIREQIFGDIDAMQSVFDRLELNAAINPKRCFPGGKQLAFYGIELNGKTTIAKVANVLPDLTSAISRSRRAVTHLRFDPVFMQLEAEHPAKESLVWSPSIFDQTPPHEMYVGCSYRGGEQPVTVSFDDFPHILVAGETGSGKSVLMANMLLSLAYSSSPSELGIVLIDLKNQDLAPFKKLPHVLEFVGEPEQAGKTIKKLIAEKKRRVACDDKNFAMRIVLVIDELGELATLEGVIKDLGSLMMIGRGILINVIVGTQSPTESGGVGTIMKANIPLRLVGKVSGGQSFASTQRKAAQAHLLPGKGSFLHIGGPDVQRFQVFLLDHSDYPTAMGMIGQRWGSRRSTASTTTRRDRDRTSVIAPVEAVVEVPVEAIVEDFQLPEPEPVTDEIDEMAKMLLPHVDSASSKNQLCKLAFGKGYAGTSFCRKVDEALSRLQASTASTTPSSTASTHRSRSSRRDKLITFNELRNRRAG